MQKATTRIKNAVVVACLTLDLSGCADPESKPVEQADLLAGAWVSQWVSGDIPGQGEVGVAGEVLVIGSGRPMSGARFLAWERERFPVVDYEIRYETMRVEGRDIFGMVTFPVGDAETHVTFVVGGWGGTVTGISNIDFSDANENQTRGEHPFENDRWYRVRVEVRPDVIKAWIDDKLVVNVSIQGRELGLRPGYADHCLPFGFATYGSTARIRSVQMRRLLPEL